MIGRSIFRLHDMETFKLLRKDWRIVGVSAKALLHNGFEKGILEHLFLL